MVGHYYHLHDEESRRQMANLDLIGNKTGKQSPGIQWDCNQNCGGFAEPRR